MNATHLTDCSKADQIQHELIKGDFSPEDAKEIVNRFITDKIDYHVMRSFSHKERYGEIDQHSEQAIEELKTSRLSLNGLLAIAKADEKSVRVESIISLKIL